MSAEFEMKNQETSFPLAFPDSSWEKKREEVAKLEDNLERGMDVGIIDTVTVLNLLEFPTSGSCEGHIDSALANPWVDVRPSGKPNWEYNDEEGITRRIAAKYALEPGDLWAGSNNEEANREYRAALEASGQTEDYLHWTKALVPSMDKLQVLIDRFNADRSDVDTAKLRVMPLPDLTRVIVGQPETRWDKEESEEERSAVAARLAERQHVMTAFTEFLRKEYAATPRKEG